MADTSAAQKVTASSDVHVDYAALDTSIGEFAGPNSSYYARAFHRIHDKTGWLPTTFNPWAAVLGPLWAASRAIWGMFWGFLILEIIAWVQIGRGAWGNPGAELMERATTQQARAQEFLDRAAAATTEADVERFEKLADNIGKAAQGTLERAEAAQAESFGIMPS